MENAKIQKFKCDILRNFQTMWIHGSLTCVRFVAHNVIYVAVSENTPYSNISGILQDRPKMQFGSLVIGNVVSRWYVKCKHPLSISLSSCGHTLGERSKEGGWAINHSVKMEHNLSTCAGKKKRRRIRSKTFGVKKRWRKERKRERKSLRWEMGAWLKSETEGNTRSIITKYKQQNHIII